MKLTDSDDETPIARGQIVRPVVFFSEWLGVVLTEPRQYEPTDEDNDMLIYAPQAGEINPYVGYHWEGIMVVDVYWFTQGERTEEFVDFLEIVSPPQDEFDDPDYFRNRYNFVHEPDVVVGSSRGGAVAMAAMPSAPLVLVAPAWAIYAPWATVSGRTTVIHSRDDDIIPYEESEKLRKLFGVELIEAGISHRMSDHGALEAILHACEVNG
jgi:predicted alpha/beta hydrolase family esterase